MLFSDGAVAKFNDLTIYESSIQAVASSLGIDLTGKLELAKQYVATKLRIFLHQNGGEALDSDNVVVTSELRNWLILRALAETYRDAYHSDLNDRYGAKWKLFTGESQEAERDLYAAGVGVVLAPVSRPSLPDVQLLTGTQPAGTYYVKTAWVSTNGDESAASEAVVVDAPAGNDLRVTPGAAAANTAGWTVYVGTSDESCVLQTPTPLVPGSTWSIPSTGLRAGVVAGDGQEPERYIVAEQRIWKG